MIEMRMSLCVAVREVRVETPKKNYIIPSTVQQLYSLGMRCYRLSATAN